MFEVFSLVFFTFHLLSGGDPLDPDTTISCLINDNALGKVEAHVADAKVG